MRAADLIQIITGGAVVVGLVLVIIELRQASEIAQAQLISDEFIAQDSQWATLHGENPARSIAKACEAPADLTYEDIEVLNAFYNRLLTRHIRLIEINRRTGFYGTDDFRRLASVSFRIIFGTPYGRFWWEHISPVYAELRPNLAQLGNEMLLAVDSNEFNCSRGPKGYSARIKSEE